MSMKSQTTKRSMEVEFDLWLLEALACLIAQRIFYLGMDMYGVGIFLWQFIASHKSTDCSLTSWSIFLDIFQDRSRITSKCSSLLFHTARLWRYDKDRGAMDSFFFAQLYLIEKVDTTRNFCLTQEPESPWPLLNAKMEEAPLMQRNENNATNG